MTSGTFVSQDSRDWALLFWALFFLLPGKTTLLEASYPQPWSASFSLASYLIALPLEFFSNTFLLPKSTLSFAFPQNVTPSLRYPFFVISFHLQTCKEMVTDVLTNRGIGGVYQTLVRAVSIDCLIYSYHRCLLFKLWRVRLISSFLSFKTSFG